MKLKISSEGMEKGNNGRKEMSLFGPGKYCLSKGLKKAVEQESTFIEKRSLFSGDSKTNMMETRGRKIIFYSSYPLIGKNFTTEIAEGSFTGAKNNYMLQSVKVSSTSVKAWESMNCN